MIAQPHKEHTMTIQVVMTSPTKPMRLVCYDVREESIGENMTTAECYAANDHKGYTEYRAVDPRKNK